MVDKRVLGLMALLVGCAALYLLLGTRGNWEFALSLRVPRLIGLILVGVSVAVSTVLFQTITRNQILTPSIMGFDALYILIVSIGVFVLGGVGFATLSDVMRFGINLVALVGVAVILFGTLLGQARQDIMRMILTGIILGLFFRSLSSLLMRLTDPNEYTYVQAYSYARFNRFEDSLLTISALLLGLCLIAVWRLRLHLDVMALGYEAAVNLGLNMRRDQIIGLCLVAVMVAVATALVGPVAFLGLLVVSLTRSLIADDRHAILLPCSALVSCVVLVSGQTLLERVLGLVTPLTVIIDLVGGTVFLWLIYRKIPA